MNKLYYCRHGITDDLENGVRNRPHAQLTREGKQQAHRVAIALKKLDIVPDVIATSTLLRAQQTANIIASSSSDIPVVESELLNERWCGIAVGMKNSEIKRQYPEGFDTVPEAEKIADLQDRMASAALWLAGLEEETILVVGHGVSGRAIARYYAERPHSEEYDRQARQWANLDNGQIMRLVPSPVVEIVRE